MIYAVKGFGLISKAELAVFLERSCFFNDPADVGNLISGSPAFSKSSLNIWNFIVHVLLKPVLENFEHCFANVWNECNCMIVSTFFDVAFLWDRNKNWPFQSCVHCWVFQICWYIECSIFTASSFRIWNSSTGIPSPPLALFVVMLLIPEYLALGEWSYPCDYLGFEDLFCKFFCVVLPPLLNIFCFC